MTTGSGRLPPITRVTGGVAGMAATYDAVRRLAGSFEEAGSRLREHAAADARLMRDADLLESAVLSPLSFAEAEAHLTDATCGVHGLVSCWGGCEALGLLVRTCVGGLEEADRLVGAALGGLDYLAGREVGLAAPGVLLAAAAAAPLWERLPEPTRGRLEHGLERKAQRWEEQHPAAVQHAVDGVGGLLDGMAGLAGLAGFHPSVGDATRDLARLYPSEGPPRVVRRRDLTVAAGSAPPRGLEGLMRHLGEVNTLSLPDRPHDQGTIEVQTFRGAHGTVRHIVYLPGTDHLATTPWHVDAEARDLPADLRAVAGDPTTYTAGIEQAMTEAGIGPHDPVLLVGHSLGGIEASSMLAHGSGFTVTHVVTAGSPIGGTSHFPAGTHVLSLENRGDLVPLLDGRDNPDSREQVTVQFDDPEASIVGDHRLRHYVAGARALEACDDPSVREQLRSLHTAGFLGSHGVATSQIFQVTR